MVYAKGDLVQYKKYYGRINYYMEENKSYVVTLFDYHGFKEIDRPCYQHELCEALIQMTI